ncbi:MAG: hypothetical protein KIT02_06750 [Devosia sp.]|uniref:hypothetical protein n=1 Tax=Devosia sp. TaxID=1871048 RepID=UPI0024C711EB|nr:hypothetical protein [Devosia sp.]UYO00895.1 MAG: hypothetical protein KIT02_06750 [Devosia sp.]
MEAVTRIEKIRSDYLAGVGRAWAGLERQLLLELVRSLDETAFAFHVAPNGAELLEQDTARNLMMLGASTALAPLLTLLRDDPGGVPWAPSDSRLARLADDHLIECGKFSVVHRLASLERYGLAEISFPSPDKLVIEVEDDGPEAGERAEGGWLGAQQRLRLAKLESGLVAKKEIIGRRIGSYTTAAGGWSIAYDPDDETFGYHRDLAEVFAAGTAELDSLPPASMIGGRSFDEWNGVSVEAYGKVLHHIACATKLKSQQPRLNLRNLLTVFSRKEDIHELWGGGTKGRQVLDLLGLDADAAARLDRNHEIPIPYYIDFGRDFVLLPMFGALMNPIAGMTGQLRHLHRRDWDRSLNAREAVFRTDLAEELGSERYFVPGHGFNLQKDDGSDLTDVDAAVVDRKTGELCLIQLKWPDIYGRSLAERESRRTNLVKANEWVERVHRWIAGRNSADVCKALHLAHGSDRPVSLMVLTRHVADFVATRTFDRRAIWTSWPRLARTVSENRDDNFLAALVRRADRPAARHWKTVVNEYRFPGLSVEVRVS